MFPLRDGLTCWLWPSPEQSTICKPIIWTLCQIKTGYVVIQLNSVIITPSVFVCKISAWMDTSENCAANEMHLAWWICIAWSTKCGHWSPEVPGPLMKVSCSSGLWGWPVTHNRLWKNNLGMLGWPDKMPAHIWKIYHHTKSAMFIRHFSLVLCVYFLLINSC